MKNIIALTFILFFFCKAYTCKCLIEYDLLLPADLILLDNDFTVFEGEIISIQADTATFKVLNWYKGAEKKDTIKIFFSTNKGYSCEIASPSLNEKYLIGVKYRTNQMPAIGYCSYYKSYLNEINFDNRLRDKPITVHELTEYWNYKDYLKEKAFFEQLVFPKKDGTFKIYSTIYSKNEEKEQLVVEGEIINKELKWANVYNKSAKLAFRINR